MATITLRGNPIHTVGELPAAGSTVPDFKLTQNNMQDVSLKDFEGKRKVLNIVPSLDTPVCQASARRFNTEADKVPNTVVLVISADLPMAQKRFCEGEGLKNVIPLSELRTRDFGQDYGVRISDGPLAGLLSRAVLVLDEQNRVIHAEQVPEIAQEPDYDRALAALKG